MEEAIKTLGIYNTDNNNIIPMEDEEVSNMAKDQYEKFSSNDDEINMNALMKTLNDKEIKNANDALVIAKLVQRRIKGEEFNPYKEFPESIQNLVNAQLAEVGQLSDRRSRAMVSKMLLDEIVEEYQSTEFGMDLDAMLASLKQEEEKAAIDIAKDTADLLMSLDEERRSSIEIGINKAKENNDDETLKKLESMKLAMDEISTLDKFKEYCKTVKIKKFDLEKPNRIFDSFNQKYINHKNNISNIADCPSLLNQHIDDPDSNLKYCLAFCKYCMNMSPDNIEEHTFMYYFIRNIILLDRLNPHGKLYDTMDEKSKTFYDNRIALIKECSSYIK